MGNTVWGVVNTTSYRRMEANGGQATFAGPPPRGGTCRQPTVQCMARRCQTPREGPDCDTWEPHRGATSRPHGVGHDRTARGRAMRSTIDGRSTAMRGRSYAARCKVEIPRLSVATDGGDRGGTPVEAHVTATRARDAGPGDVEHCTRGSSDKGDVTKCTRRATAKATPPRAFDGGIDGVARDNDWGGVVPDSTARGAASGNIWTPSADHTGWDTTMPRTVDEWCRQPPVQRERQNDAISGER